MRWYLGYLCNGWCGHGCDWEERYDDFVIEACCPIHDPCGKWQRWLQSIVTILRPLPDSCYRQWYVPNGVNK